MELEIELEGRCTLARIAQQAAQLVALIFQEGILCRIEAGVVGDFSLDEELTGVSVMLEG